MFKYVNPGYISLFDQLQKEGKESTSIKNNPQNGISFNTNGEWAYVEPKEITEKIWVKFDFYYDYSGTNNYMLSISTKDNTIQLREKKTGDFAVAIDDIDIGTAQMEQKKITSIEVGIDVSGESGKVEMYANNKKSFSCVNEKLKKSNISKIGFKTYTNNYYSNIIIQDTGRVGTEKIAILPVASTESEWETNTNGSYTTIEAEKTIMQTVDVEALRNNISPTPGMKINSMSVAAINTYSESETINNLATVISNGQTEKEIETKQLGTAENGGIYNNAMPENPIEGGKWTIESLKNVKFGIRTKMIGS